MIRITHRWLRIWSAAVLLLIVTAALAPAAQMQAQSDIICFEETGECISGVIRAYWEANGGLDVFGYPIAPLRTETHDGWTGPTQWFQRDRLEDHGSEGVLTGRLGAQLLELQGRPWEVAFEQVSAVSVPASCAYFTETGHSLCEPFLSYWNANGGVERFGFPITEPFTETIDDWTGTVQYFERRRAEFHTELPGSPMLLGLLGSEVLALLETPAPPPTTVPTTPPPTTGPAPIPDCVEPILARTDPNRSLLRTAYEAVEFREVMGCPIAYLADRPSANQRMERGEMLWIDNGYPAEIAPNVRGRFIYVLFSPGPRYGKYIDPWIQGVDPLKWDVEPPRAGLYPPWGGFGKLWLNNIEVREGVGWAIEEEAREGRADIVIFDNVYNDLNNLGAMVLFRDTGAVYAFGRLDQPDEVQVIVP